MIENITTADYGSDLPFSPAKKIYLGEKCLIFVSGIQPPKGVTEDIAEQTKLVYEEINNILTSAGATMDDVVKAVIYVTDMNDFKVISPIRNEYFKNSKPVSTMVEVNGMTRSDAKIEIEVTAVISK